MIHIDTEVRDVILEIDDGEFELAPRTVETMEKLAEAERSNKETPYKMWLAQMEILLGKTAVKKLFPNGKKENLDRMQLIYVQVARAFMHVDEQLASSTQDQKLERAVEKLAPITDLLKNYARAVNAGQPDTGGIRKIYRPD